MGTLEDMTAAAAAAADVLPIAGDVRATEANHRQETQELGPPVAQLHLVCALPGCDQSVFCLAYDVTGGAFIVTLEAIRAQIAAHVRQCHDTRVAPHTGAQ